MALINDRVAGILIHVPDDLAAPKTRKAIAHGIAARKARENAFVERDVASDLRRKVTQEIAREHGALLDEDPGAELPDGGAIVAKAQSLLDARQREVEARTEAERRAAVKIREAVTAELPVIARTSLASGDTALAMLSAALEDAVAARDALWSSIGIGYMAERLAGDPGAPIAIQHKAYGYTFDLEAAIEGLAEALTKAGAELAELRAGVKPATGKKTRATRKAASEAHNPADTASTPEPIAFEMTVDDAEQGAK